MPLINLYHYILFIAVITVVVSQQHGVRDRGTLFGRKTRCYACGSSELTSSKCGKREIPTGIPCCADPFNRSSIVAALREGSKTGDVGSEGIEEECDYCLKVRYTWRWRRPDVFVRRLCYNSRLQTSVKTLEGILNVRYNADKWWPDTSREDRWKSDRLRRDKEALEAGKCLKKREETASHDLYIELCSCFGDLCNTAVNHQISLYVIVAFLCIIFFRL